MQVPELDEPAKCNYGTPTFSKGRLTEIARRMARAEWFGRSRTEG